MHFVPFHHGFGGPKSSTQYTPPRAAFIGRPPQPLPSVQGQATPHIRWAREVQQQVWTAAYATPQGVPPLGNDAPLGPPTATAQQVTVAAGPPRRISNSAIPRGPLPVWPLCPGPSIGGPQMRVWMKNSNSRVRSPNRSHVLSLGESQAPPSGRTRLGSPRASTSSTSTRPVGSGPTKVFHCPSPRADTRSSGTRGGGPQPRRRGRTPPRPGRAARLRRRSPHLLFGSMPPIFCCHRIMGAAASGSRIAAGRARPEIDSSTALPSLPLSRDTGTAALAAFNRCRSVTDGPRGPD